MRWDNMTTPVGLRNPEQRGRMMELLAFRLALLEYSTPPISFIFEAALIPVHIMGILGATHLSSGGVTGCVDIR